MLKRNLLGYLAAFLIALTLAGGIGVVFAQANEESNDAKKATPTPTRMPKKAPSTGLGGGQ